MSAVGFLLGERLLVSTPRGRTGSMRSQIGDLDVEAANSLVVANRLLIASVRRESHLELANRFWFYGTNFDRDLIFSEIENSQRCRRGVIRLRILSANSKIDRPISLLNYTQTKKFLSKFTSDR